MGFKSNSSGQVFDDYIAGGPGADPLVVGYENQLVEWIIADPDRWKRVQARRGAQPVTLYPQPTVYSAHPLIALSRRVAAADRRDDVARAADDRLARSRLSRARSARSAPTTDPLVAGRMPAQVSDVAPMPDVDVMLAILDALRRRPRQPGGLLPPAPSNDA